MVTDKIKKNSKEMGEVDIKMKEGEPLLREVKLSKGHTSAHVNLPKTLADEWVRVIPIIPGPFVCSVCADVISEKKHFSPEKDLCNLCYKEKMAIKNNSCIECGGPNPMKTFWGRCEKCWRKEETLESVEEMLKAFKKKKKEGGKGNS